MFDVFRPFATEFKYYVYTFMCTRYNIIDTYTARDDVFKYGQLVVNVAWKQNTFFRFFPRTFSSHSLFFDISI